MHSFRSEPEAITHARRAAEEGRLSVDLRVGDVRALRTDVRADVAICMGNASGYLEHAVPKRSWATSPVSSCPAAP